MASVGMTICVEFDPGAMEALEIAADVHELADLVPDWQHAEAQQIVERIGETLRRTLVIGQGKKENPHAVAE